MYGAYHLDRTRAGDWQKYAGHPYFDTRGIVITACVFAPSVCTIALQAVSTPLVLFMRYYPSPASTATGPYVTLWGTPGGRMRVLC